MKALNSESDHVTVAIPRSALTIIEAPRCVSQRTAERILGVPRRAFLDLLGRYRDAGGTVLCVGKLRIAEIDPLLEWLRSMEAQRAAAPPKAANDAADPADDMAERLGLTRVFGGGRGR